MMDYVDKCKKLGWIAIGCLSLYIIIAFILSILGLGFSLVGLIFGAVASIGGDSSTAATTTATI